MPGLFPVDTKIFIYSNSYIKIKIILTLFLLLNFKVLLSDRVWYSPHFVLRPNLFTFHFLEYSLPDTEKCLE